MLQQTEISSCLPPKRKLTEPEISVPGMVKQATQNAAKTSTAWSYAKGSSTNILKV